MTPESETHYVREVVVNYRPTGRTRHQITDERTVAEFVRSVLPDNSREHLVALYLDGSHHVASYAVVSSGTANGCQVHPREVFQRAILSGAASLVIAHNHPSGSLKPSEQDEEVTQRIRKAGDLLGIKLLDHVIVTDDGCHSFKARGGL